jgi:hypothetical protein
MNPTTLTERRCVLCSTRGVLYGCILCNKAVCVGCVVLPMQICRDCQANAKLLGNWTVYLVNTKLILFSKDSQVTLNRAEAYNLLDFLSRSRIELEQTE